ASAAASAVAWVVWKPSAPVKQFAPPEFKTIAEATPSLIACWDQRMGFALARFMVKTAAAARDGPSFTTRATSSPPDALRPAATPAAVKPCAAVTLKAPPRSFEAL